jgi:hypothetical protein
MDTYIHTYVPSFMLRSYTWTPGLVDARASEYPYVCRHTRAWPSAVLLRTMAAPHRRPAERIHRGARRRPEAAPTPINAVTDAVFHAPMFTLNAVAW